ncbi:hypothetical protein A3Q56_02285 [Intoshia linei]|uniref:Uncharacterized protein n=1 Tax=Intoshia linei TaxID=1819745 RepID=A0A177B6P6_9BILA|nr:hypothetical protein A3Q56_02285 [Intoshia linei]
MKSIFSRNKHLFGITKQNYCFNIMKSCATKNETLLVDNNDETPLIKIIKNLKEGDTFMQSFMMSIQSNSYNETLNTKVKTIPPSPPKRFKSSKRASIRKKRVLLESTLTDASFNLIVHFNTSKDVTNAKSTKINLNKEFKSTSDIEHTCNSCNVMTKNENNNQDQDLCSLIPNQGSFQSELCSYCTEYTEFSFNEQKDIPKYSHIEILQNYNKKLKSTCLEYKHINLKNFKIYV